MARVRLIVALLLAGCARGEAAPEAMPAKSGLVAPRGWQAAPALAKAAADAAKSSPAGTPSTITVAGSEAWAEPARGCYALWLSLGGKASDVVAAGNDLTAALAKAGITIRGNATASAGEHATLAFGFDRGTYHGTLRAELASTGAVTALACAWNAREPAACEAACKTFGGAK